MELPRFLTLSKSRRFLTLSKSSKNDHVVPKLRDVNLAIEQCAWGAFDTEFFATYDFRPVWERIRAEKG